MGIQGLVKWVYKGLGLGRHGYIGCIGLRG